jgi:radical SAM superfamily enzyme YgiQ (UPF0313 family)
MKRILFVMPHIGAEYGSARRALTGDENGWNPFVPLPFATLAAMTPPEFEIEIWDEALRGSIDQNTRLGKEFDLVGVTGFQHNLPRANQIAGIMRKRGILTAIGGPGVSGSPEVCRGSFDVLFIGEAELTWPRFLSEWKRGVYQAEYRQIDRVDMSISPAPKWDAIAKDIPRYLFGSVQTTRGCPYDCEFCDVIHLFGRKPRHKPIERVLEEVANLERLGVSRIFISDDDFVGDFKYAKQLLRELIPLNNSFKKPLAFQTQADISVARDDELLELLADCNFHNLYIGIETPRVSSLKETHKLQNLRLDLLEACRKVHSHGLSVWALMIVGFDSDDKDIFDEQVRFLEDANIISMGVNVLKAYRGTPLWIRLQQENRVVDVSEVEGTSTRALTNIIPKQMTRSELLEGYWGMMNRVRSWESLEKRVIGFVDGVKRQPRVKSISIYRRLLALAGFLIRRLTKKSQLPEEGRRVWGRVLRHTLRTRPYLMDRVMFVMAHESGEILSQDQHRPMIQRQIDHERAGRIRLERDPSAGKVPADFRRKLLDVLPWIYDQLAERITDRQAITVAMLGVVKDFLVRWGDGFSGFEPYHKTYLAELCDRHAERAIEGEADRSRNDIQPATRAQLVNPQFVQALLAGVEQDLRSDAKGVLATAQNA